MCDTVKRFEKIKDVEFIGYKVVCKTKGKHFLSPFLRCQYKIGIKSEGVDENVHTGIELYNGIHVFKNKKSAINYAKNLENLEEIYIVLCCVCSGLTGEGLSVVSGSGLSKSYTVKFCTPTKIVWKSQRMR